jgi:two-component system response regulator YesN
MPQIDGIELVARIDGMDFKPYTVVLSGYDDFKYAQKAIKYGVKAYLLKPVDRNELLNIVKKAEEEYLKKQNSEASLHNMESSEFFSSQLKLMLLSDYSTRQEAEKLFHACNMDLTNNKYRVVSVNSCEVYAYEDKLENNMSLVHNIMQYLNNSGTYGLSFMDNKNNLVLILNVKTNVNELMDTINKMYGTRCTAGIGGAFQDVAEMRISYGQSDYALKYKLIASDKTVINYGDITEPDHNYVMPVRLIKNLAGMLDTERKDDLCKVINQIFEESNIRKYHLEYLEKLSTCVRTEIIGYLSEYIPHKIEFIKEQEEGFKSIFEFYNLSDYLRYLKKFVLNINEVLLRFKNNFNTDKTIEMALKYVQENYRNDLTMAEVANHISLNYSYFSILFKEKIGMNFVDYLRMIRIEKAKELLQNSIYKIYEVSEMVGYNNTKHFTTTFRALTGISPKEYREKLYIN